MTIRSTVINELAATYDLIALSDFKVDAGIVGNTDDAYLTRAISRASAAISQYCDRVFAAEVVADTFERIGSEASLKLSRYPVIEVVSITSDGAPLVDSIDYRIDETVGRIYPVGARFSTPLKVTYRAGFDPIPLDIQTAAGEMVKALQFNRSRDPSLRSENILSGLYAYTLYDGSGAGSTQQVSAILDSYRMPAL